MKMDVSSHQSIDVKATILDLNDDCLRQVFDCMYLDHLAVVADVCTRFRKNAVEVASLKYKHVYLETYPGMCDIKKLRNFGGSIETVNVDGHSKLKFQKRTIKLLSLYCRGKAIDLKLNHFNITEKVALLMVPLLGRLQKLKLHECRAENEFFVRLSSPDLRELEFASCDDLEFEEDDFHFLHQKLPKLESIGFLGIDDVDNRGMEEFLRQNPQLKKIEVALCRSVDAHILQSIVKYVPEVESLNFNWRRSLNEDNIKYLGQLRKLKSLNTGVGSGGENYLHTVATEIASAEIPLEFLQMNWINLRYKTQEFVEAISKMTKLKTLRMAFLEIPSTSHFIDMCKPLTELSEIYLRIHHGSQHMTIDDILELLQNAEKLQKFEYYTLTPVSPAVCIDVGTFEKIVKIVESRREKTKLNLILDKCAFSTQLPAELTRSARKLVQLDLAG